MVGDGTAVLLLDISTEQSPTGFNSTYGWTFTKWNFLKVESFLKLSSVHFFMNPLVQKQRH